VSIQANLITPLAILSNWKLETGNWKLEAGSWKLETGS
jgi:hypothetical protein